MTSRQLGTGELAGFTRFLRWRELSSGGLVSRVEDLSAGSVTWTDPAGARYRTDLASGRIESLEPPVPAVAPQPVRPPDAEGLPAVFEVPGPDGHRLTEAGHNLALRLDDTTVHPLTTSGTAERPWRINAQVSTLLPAPPVWSPDGRRVFSIRADLTGIPEYPLVDWRTFPVTTDHVRISSERSGVPRFTAAFVDTTTGTLTGTDLVDDDRTLLPLRWTADGAAFLAVLATGTGVIELVRIDAETGTVRALTSDKVPLLMPYLGPLLGAILTPLPVPGQLGWLSDADGDLRLYQVDLGSGQRVALTPPGIQVVRVVGVDAEQHLLLLVRSDPERPYDVHVARTAPDGSFSVLTAEAGAHNAILAPDGRAFVDVHSALTRPPRSEVRELNGNFLGTITAADTRAADELGRAEPREFRVKAADGHTDLHGVLYLPPDFDPGRRYPVIDSVYGGPQAITYPQSWADPPAPSGTLWTGFSGIAQAFAQLGFIGVVLDARGTPGRGRDFQAAATQGFGTLGVQDRVAALRALANQHPWIDISRTGAIGISFGGYFAARCGIVAPDIYRAVVAAAGPYDPELTPPYWFQALLGAPLSGDPAAFAEAGVVAHAGTFEPELLLIHGTHDVNVPLATTMRFSNALVQAGKHHELLLLQGQSHQLAGGPGEFALREAAQFFHTHLIDKPHQRQGTATPAMEP
ncbi:hypothetical protein GCM10022222_09250 [Amycolatopsis ultiminotia]|uniref:Dipeptidyl aminopeptidase/acylaminoacyl peptidase n=1 Tax=Amycolatopsis ultiminotia TaxID=543629 RepID=A0ABP6V4U3_9PSEU